MGPCCLKVTVPETAWHREGYVFFVAVLRGDGKHRVYRAKSFDHLLHQKFGSGGAGCDAHRTDAFEPIFLHVGGRIDQLGRAAVSFGYFTESVGVGAGNGPHDQYEVAGIGQTLDGILAILRGVADVVFFGSVMDGNLALSAEITSAASSTEIVVCVT